MTVEIGTLAAHAQALGASISSEGDGTAVAYLLLLSGFVFYALVYLRYRNSDKRHKHESETIASMHHLRTSDEYRRSLRGVSNSRMRGANNREVRGARRG